LDEQADEDDEVDDGMVLGYVDSGLQEEFGERDAVEELVQSKYKRGELGACPDPGSPLAHGPVE
jgi:hypothetical protein